MLFTLILIVHVLVCLVLIASVLVQQGKGASMGAAFGTAGSQTIFGSSGAGNFLTKTTSVCAAIFFATSLLLAYRSSFRRSVVDLTEPEGGAPTEPAKPVPAGAPAKAPEKGAAPAAPAPVPAAPVQGAKQATPAAPTAAAPAPMQAAPAPAAPKPAAPAPAP
ncbi:MAG TPA: preprotein translocase subunit SecG [Anaeromyxobacteraceae bacterium]|nr:preprotein translocase subunit SecG [Anaeromyxobacteraceae bacterium]